MSIPNTFTWEAAVQEHELDIQQIVNNSVYLQYFDRARIQHLLSKGIDWEAWHKNGFNLVLVHVDMEIKNSLKAQDKFYVKSTYEKSGKLRVIYHQAIYRKNDDKLIAKAKNTMVCVSLKSGKPIMPDKLGVCKFPCVNDHSVI